MKPKVYVTRKLPSKRAMDLLFKYLDVDLREEEVPPSKEEMIAHLEDKDALLCLLTDKVDAETIRSAPKLKVISTYSVGFDHIDVEEATTRGIYVTNTPGVLTEAVADLTWALILAITRRIVEADRCVRTPGCWRIGWAPDFMLGMELNGKTLGIIGLGRIGTAVARRAKGFGMNIIYYDVIRREDLEKELGVKYVPLKELLKEADIVSIHVPLTKETYHMIKEEELRLMKPTAYLVNTARGAIIDTNALVRALKEGWIRGAALDVFEQEPLPADHPLTKLKNVVLVPHIGSATYETRAKMADMAVDNLLSVLAGKRPPNLVNPEVFKIRPLEKVKMIELEE